MRVNDLTSGNSSFENSSARTGMFSLDIASESPIAGTYHHLRHGNRITLFTYSRA